MGPYQLKHLRRTTDELGSIGERYDQDMRPIDDEFEPVEDEFEPVVEEDEFEPVLTPKEEAIAKTDSKYTQHPPVDLNQIPGYKEGSEALAPIGKGFLNTASWGLSEHADSLKATSEQKDTWRYTIGQALGLVPATYHLVQGFGLAGAAALAKLAVKSPAMKAVLPVLADFSATGAAGGTYGGTKFSIESYDKETGDWEAPSPEYVAQHAAEWMAFHGAFKILGSGVKQWAKAKKALRDASPEGKNEILTEIAQEMEKTGLDPRTEPKAYTEQVDKISERILERQHAERQRPKDQSAAVKESALAEGVQKTKAEVESGVKEAAEARKEIPKAEKVEVDAKDTPVQPQKRAKVESTKPKMEQAAEKPKGKKKTEVKIPDPIVETTGKGASEQIVYVKGTSKKVLEGVNSFIESAKTPKESFKRLTQGVNSGVARFIAPLENLEKRAGIHQGDAPSTYLRLAQNAASEVDAVINNGAFSSMTGRFEGQSLKGAYAGLTEEGAKEVNVLRAARSALLRQKQGIKTGIDTAKAQADVARLNPVYGQRADMIRQAQKDVNSMYGKNLIGEKGVEGLNKDYHTSLYRLMDSGPDSLLISGSLTPKQPFHKIKGSERKILAPHESDPYNMSMMILNSRRNDAVLALKDQIVKGQLPGKVVKAKLEEPPASALKEAGVEPSETATNVYHQNRKEGFTPRKNTLRGWENGKAFELEVPEDIYNIWKQTNQTQQNWLGKFVQSTNKAFSRSISLDPRKAFSIASRDALETYIFNKTGQSPLSVFEALGDIYGDKAIYKQFIAMGGDSFARNLSTRQLRHGKIKELLTPGKEGPVYQLAQLPKLLKKYPEMLNEMSMAVPLAQYKSALKRFGDTPQGRRAAAIEAKNIAYDPKMKGSNTIVRGLCDYVPFMNVSIQEASSIARNLNTRSNWLKGITALTMPALVLKYINEGNPNYEDLTPDDKAGFYHVFWGDQHYRFATPWLLSSVFKLPAEAFYDMVRGPEGSGKESSQAILNDIVRNLSGTNPPILQALIEQTTGKSPASPLGTLLGVDSRAPEIVPKRLQNLPPELQYTSKTSYLAKKYGEMFGGNPIKFERFVKTFGTNVAADIFALTDEVAYWTGLAEDNRPEATNLMIANFVSEQTPTRTKYQQDFYKLLDQQTQQDAARKIVPDYGEDWLDEVDLGKYNRSISKLFKARREIEDDKELTARQKRLDLEENQKQINSLYKEAVVPLLEAKNAKPTLKHTKEFKK